MTPYRGITTIIRTGTDRALKASPTGSLRPALTALPVLSEPLAEVAFARPRSSRAPPSLPSRKSLKGLRYAETLLDKTRFFRHADMRRFQRS
jgi:hypothetical protein